MRTNSDPPAPESSTSTALERQRFTPGQSGNPAHRFKPGQSGNPEGRPKAHREYLTRRYGADCRKLFEELEVLRRDPKTPRRVKADICKFLIEQMVGRAPVMVGVESGPSLLSLLMEMTARTSTVPPSEP